jgi:O-antigen/teichoic acid export membrane protein
LTVPSEDPSREASPSDPEPNGVEDVHRGPGGSTPLARTTSHAVFWNVILVPLLAILSLASSALVARHLSLDEYRVYGLATAAIASLLLWTDLGLSSAVARFTPEIHRVGPGASSRFLGGAARIRILSLAVIVGLLVAGRHFWSGSQALLPFEGLSLVLIIATVTFQSIARIYQYYLTGMFKRRAIGLILLVAAAGQSGLVILATLAGFGVTGVLAAFAVAALVELVLSRSASIDRASADTGAEVELPRELVRDAGRFGIVSFLEKTASYLNSPPFVVFLIASLGAPREVAYFTVASEFSMRIVSMLSVPLSGITLPLFSTVEARGDREQSATVLRLYLMLLFLLFAPTAALLSGSADIVLPLVYGSRYQDAVPLLKVLVPFLFLEYTVYSALLAALMTRREYGAVLLSKLPLVGGVVAVSLAIPGWGALGAVVAFGAARLLSAAWLLRSGLHHLRFRFPGVYAAKVLGASTGAGLAVAFAARALSSGWSSLAALLLLGGAVFVALYELLGGMDPADRDLITSGMPPYLRRFKRLL